jgi:hypothetical protein
MDLGSIVLYLNKKDFGVEWLKSTAQSTMSLEKVPSDTQHLRATWASKVLQILQPSPKGP